MTACVIGTRLRETSIAGTVIQQAGEIPSGDPREAKVIDNLYKIRFTPNGTFLPQSEGDVFDFPGRVGDHPGIEVDPMTLDDGDSAGSRSRDIAAGIFALLPPRSVQLGEYSILLKIKVAGTGVSFKPFLFEVSFTPVVHRESPYDGSQIPSARSALSRQGDNRDSRQEAAFVIADRR